MSMYSDKWTVLGLDGSRKWPLQWAHSPQFLHILITVAFLRFDTSVSHDLACRHSSNGLPQVFLHSYHFGTVAVNPCSACKSPRILIILIKLWLHTCSNWARQLGGLPLSRRKDFLFWRNQQKEHLLRFLVTLLRIRGRGYHDYRVVSRDLTVDRRHRIVTPVLWCACALRLSIST